MTMHRAFSLLSIEKAATEGDQRIISGIATTPEADRVGDIIEPLGARFKNPLPLLWQHRSDQPIGHATFENPTEKGIRFTARLPKIEEPGVLKDRIDEAWQSIKSGLVRAVSIGFRSIEHSVMETGGWRFLETEILELSAVTIPANASATITTIKAADAELRAASGREEAGVTTAQAVPGVTGKPRKPVTLSRGSPTMTKPISEHIAALEETRAAKAALMDETVQKSIDEGRSMDEAEKESFDDLEAEIASIDADLKRFKSLERAKAASAKPVEQVRSVEQGTQARAGVQIKRRENLAPGVGFARLAKCKAIGRLDGESPREIAKTLYGEDSNIYGMLTKANVSAGSTASGSWAEDLVGTETSVFADFVEYLRPMTIIGKFGQNGVPALRRVPFRTALISQTGGGQGYWVGEGAGKPLTAFDFSRTTIEPLKVANIAVVTEEVLRDSSPSAEMLLRDGLAAALQERLDTDFIDPAKTASAGISPASITNGATANATAGNTADNVRSDVRVAVNAFVAANNRLSSGVWIMSEQTAVALSMLRNSLGQDEFAGITRGGGTLAGFPVITSEYVGAVSAGHYAWLVNASDIYLADDGGVQVDMSREASLNMVDNPTINSITPTATSVVSMFQTNSVAFRAERTINWAKRRAEAVVGISGVDWGE